MVQETAEGYMNQIGKDGLSWQGGHSFLIDGGIPVHYLLDYCPVSKAGSGGHDWEVRNLVWDFKNSRGDVAPQRVEDVRNLVLEGLEDILRKTYGQRLCHMMLVCLPASTQDKTERRFHEFSERLCANTGMENAFSRIRVVVDARPKHEGGCGTPCIQIDPGFLKGKEVLLFDDVYTSGSSMRYYISQMEKRGAHVVGCMTLACTKSEKRPERHSLSDIVRILAVIAGRKR